MNHEKKEHNMQSRQNPPENPVPRPRGGTCKRLEGACKKEERVLVIVTKENPSQKYWCKYHPSTELRIENQTHAPQNDLSQWVLGIPLCHSSQVDDRLLGGFVPPEVRKDQFSQYRIVNYRPKND